MTLLGWPPRAYATRRPAPPQEPEHPVTVAAGQRRHERGLPPPDITFGFGLACPLCHTRLSLVTQSWRCQPCTAVWDLRGLHGRWSTSNQSSNRPTRKGCTMPPADSDPVENNLRALAATRVSLRSRVPSVVEYDLRNRDLLGVHHYALNCARVCRLDNRNHGTGNRWAVAEWLSVAAAARTDLINLRTRRAAQI